MSPNGCNLCPKRFDEGTKSKSKFDKRHPDVAIGVVAKPVESVLMVWSGEG